MKKLDIEQSVRAIFVLCSDVSRLTVHGMYYFYFKPERRIDIKVIKYILKQNGIDAKSHLTHYYTNSDASDLIVRVPVLEMENYAPVFKRELDTMYKNKTDLVGCGLISADKKPVLFNLWSAHRKQKFINNIANRTR